MVIRKQKSSVTVGIFLPFRNMENFPTKLNWSPMEYHLYMLMRFMLWRRFHQDQYLDLFLKPSGQNQMEKRLIKYSIIFWLVWLGQIWIYPVAHGNYNIILKNYWIGIVMNITWLHCVHFLIADYSLSKVWPRYVPKEAFSPWGRIISITESWECPSSLWSDFAWTVH